MSTSIQKNQQATQAIISKQVRIPIYQTSEKLHAMNATTVNNKISALLKDNTPVLANIIEKLSGQQTGIIIGKDPSRCHALFNHYSYEIKRVSLHEDEHKIFTIAGKPSKLSRSCVSRYVSNTAATGQSPRKLIWINLPEKGPLKISDIQSIVQAQINAGVAIEWISIIQHPSHQHLFKWELIC